MLQKSPKPGYRPSSMADMGVSVWYRADHVLISMEISQNKSKCADVHVLNSIL